MTVGNWFQWLRFKKYSASLTVEASYVMSIIILALVILVRTAYMRCGKTAEVMRLHCAVEQLRYREEEQKKIFSCGQAQRKGSQAEGYIDRGTWKKEIAAKICEPEEFLRRIAAFEMGDGTQEGQED